jgi:hypothetical protein
MLNVDIKSIMLNVATELFILSVIMLNVATELFILSVIMLNVALLNVSKRHGPSQKLLTKTFKTKRGGGPT